MKKVIYLTLLLFAGFAGLHAQEKPNEEALQKMQEKQIKKMAKDFKLDDETKAKFTELYRQHRPETHRRLYTRHRKQPFGCQHCRATEQSERGTETRAINN